MVELENQSNKRSFWSKEKLLTLRKADFCKICTDITP